MLGTQDLYTTLLGVKGQVEKDSEAVDELCRSYNNVISYFRTDENNVSTLTKKLKELTELAEGIDKLLNGKNVCDTIDSNINTVTEGLMNPLKKFLGKMAPVVADSVYDVCDRLRDDYDLFEAQIWNHLPGKISKKVDFPGGLTSKNNIRVFLMGEFSTGKTTFIQRLLMQKAGEIASSPTTGLLVIHKVSSDESMEVVFNNSFHLSNTSGFDKFLAKYNLGNEFEQNGENWKLRHGHDGHIWLNPSFNSSKLMDFVTDANNYAEAFSEIHWMHRRRGGNNGAGFFDFADLYDMPGIGASNEQHDASIGHALEQYSPDIILYFVNSGSAIPSADGSRLLKIILEKTFSSVRQPVFFWVYEKPKGGESDERKVTLKADGLPKIDDSFLSGGKDSNDKGIKDALREYIEGTHTNDENFSFTDKQKEYLLNTFILDVRGEKSDSVFIANSFSLAVRQYFLKRSKELVNNIKNALPDSSFASDAVFDFINKVTEGENYSIKSILDEIGRLESIDAGTVKLEVAKDSFVKKLYLDQEESVDEYPDEVKDALERMKKDIIYTVNDILSKFTNGFGNKTIDTKKVIKDFENLYKKNEKWQDLIFYVQGYHWLRYAYIGRITSSYLLGPGSAILAKIEKDVQKLELVKTELPLCVPLQ